MHPEIVPSTFDELLPHSDFAEELGAYAAATSAEKAIEVFTRLVQENPAADPPDLIISADTVIVYDGMILEKPGNKLENLRMLLELNGTAHEVHTGVTVLWPQIAYPGYAIRSVCVGFISVKH